jgi:biotin carboxylase
MTDRPRLLLVAPHSSYRITPYLSAAQSLGVDVLVASTSEHSLVSAVAEGLRIDLAHPEQAIETILKTANERPFAGVVATDDSVVSLAARVAEQLGLAHNSPEAVQLTHRKDLARARLTEHGVPVPAFSRIDLNADLGEQVATLPYPCVIKPLSLSGSRGVIRVDNVEQAMTAAQRIAAIVRELGDEEERRYLLVEDYLPGIEVAVEAMLHNGNLQVLAIFDKPDPLEGPYFEETYYITPSRLAEAQQALIAQRVSEACAAYGLTTGPVHAELRLHSHNQKEQAWILEVAARTIGGQCAQLLKQGTGHGLEELVIAQAIGKPLSEQNSNSAAGVLMIPIPKAGILRRVEGLGAARRVEHILDVEIYVREGYELIPLPEGAAYLGFIFAQASKPEQVEAALREAHAQLNFVTAPVWKLQ